MNLEDQVCSLEYAKKLKEFGIKQNSLFWWRRYIPIKGSTYISPEWKISIYEGSTNNYDIISAFTASELGEISKGLFFNISINDNGLWSLYFSPDYGTDNSYTFEEKNLSDLIAKMILANHKEKEIENGYKSE